MKVQLIAFVLILINMASFCVRASLSGHDISKYPLDVADDVDDDDVYPELFDVDLASSGSGQVNLDLGGFSCGGGTCSACAQVKFKIPLTSKSVNEKACVKVSYIGKTMTAKIEATFGNYVRLSKSYSLNNPPDVLCYGIKFGAEGCISFNSLSFTKTAFKGCSSLKFKAAKVTVFSIKLGCWNIKVPGDALMITPGDLPEDFYAVAAVTDSESESFKEKIYYDFTNKRSLLQRGDEDVSFLEDCHGGNIYYTNGTECEVNCMNGYPCEEAGCECDFTSYWEDFQNNMAVQNGTCLSVDQKQGSLWKVDYDDGYIQYLCFNEETVFYWETVEIGIGKYRMDYLQFVPERPNPTVFKANSQCQNCLK